MVKRKASSGLSRPRKKARTGRRKSGRARLSRLVRMPMYKFSRWVNAQNQDSLSANAAAFGFGKEFILNHIAGATDFGNLFDQYKIIKVEVYFHLQTNPDAPYDINTTATPVINQNNWYPKIWYAADHDDSSTPTLAQMKEYQGVKCKVLEPNKMVKFTVRPRPLIQTYYTALNSGYALAKADMWLDMNNTSIPHYGMKCVIDSEGIIPNNRHIVRIDYKYFCEFRQAM